MKFRTVKIVEWITCIIMPVVLALTLIYKLWYLPLIFLFAAAVIFGILISRLKEVYEDERTVAIDAKAGNATETLGSIIMLITGAILLACSEESTSGLGIAAITLFASSVGLSLINLCTKMFYRAKLGGR
jgi:uncharacterized membrane protein